MLIASVVGLLESVAGLLFQLASADRLLILTEIEKSPMRLSEIAHKLSVTPQETSRHIAHLVESKLIERDSEGNYRATPFGKDLLSLVPSIAFLREEREYFLSHDLSSLPVGFVARLGELHDHKRLTHINDALMFQERVVRESKRFVWFMSDQPVGHALREDHSHFPEKTSLRLILPRHVDTGVFDDARKNMGSRFELGVVDDVRIVVAMNEKTAGIGFPTLDGRIDYTQGLSGGGPNFLGWCHDLFSYYWEESTKTIC